MHVSLPKPLFPLNSLLTCSLPVMNLSHVIHEFSFGPYFPRISQPLDNSACVSFSFVQRRSCMILTLRLLPTERSPLRVRCS